MIEPEHDDPHLLGQRLTAARKARGVTQEEVAAHLGCSRPTLIAIEKGVRSAKPNEIVKLAAFYGRSVHELVRPGTKMVALEPHFRAVIGSTPVATDDISSAIAELERLAADYCELERLVEAKPIGLIPPEVTLSSQGNHSDFAKDVAKRERDRLGLGVQPILNLRQVLEVDVGLRVFFGELPSAIAGMFVYMAGLGFCVFINRKHPPERQRATLVHEYGHALCDRHRPGIDYLNLPSRKSASERFAEAFGLSFLMPASGVRHKFREVTDSTGDFQVADLCRLSNFFFVSVQAMTLRLEELGLIGKGSWNLLSEKGFKPRKASEDLGLNPRHAESNAPYPQRYKFLAVQAYRTGKISEGQLSKFLRCDPVTAREIVAQARPFEDSLLNTRP